MNFKETDMKVSSGGFIASKKESSNRKSLWIIDHFVFDNLVVDNNAGQTADNKSKQAHRLSSNSLHTSLALSSDYWRMIKSLK